MAVGRARRRRCGATATVSSASSAAANATAGAGARRSRVEGGRDLLVRADHRDGKDGALLFEIEVELREPTMEATSPVERHPEQQAGPRSGWVNWIRSPTSSSNPEPAPRSMWSTAETEKVPAAARRDGKGGNGDERLPDAGGQCLQAGPDDALQALGDGDDAADLADRSAISARPSSGA